MNSFPILSIHQFDVHGLEHEFYVNTFTEHLRKHHSSILHPHTHDFYVTVLFTHGTGFHEIDFQRFDVSPGTVFFLQPGQTHHWEFSEDVEGFIFFHSATYYQLNFPHQRLHDFPFLHARNQIPILHLSRKEIVPFSNQFGALLEEFTTNKSHKYQKIASQLNCLYIDLSRCYEAHHQVLKTIVHRYSHKFELFESLVNEQYVTQKSALFYADQLHITTKHLNRISKESCGKTSTEFILDRVMLEAKRLLSSDPYNLAEISLLLGYEEYAYFSRQFKQYCNESPRDFRRKYYSMKN